MSANLTPKAQPVQSTNPDFIQRTNEDYVAWCKTFYIPEVLNERGMRSFDGLHAWQERDRRAMAQPVQSANQPVKQAYSDQELTDIYNRANGVASGKRQPITTQAIFKAMRAMRTGVQDE